MMRGHNMLKIGEFSAITGISINMLRAYNKSGILNPEAVDEKSGYRYYGEDQVAEAHRVQILKELGFSLKEIPQLSAYSDGDVKYMISRKILEKQAQVSQLQEEIRHMKQLEEVYDLYSKYNFEINMAMLPKRKVISLTENISNLKDEERLWARLDRLFDEGVITRGGKGAQLDARHVAERSEGDERRGVEGPHARAARGDISLRYLSPFPGRERRQLRYD